MGDIRVEGLGKAYKQYPGRWSRLAEWLMPRNGPRHLLHWVLKDISFHVEPGEAVGIIGINGAGKSTLLKMITGTTQPTAGSVQTTGQVAALLELGMGFHPDFTGRQNVFMAGQLLGMDVAEIATLMPEIEAFAEIGEYIDQPVRVYSSGMQMRLAFSVATAKKSDILIVDEALAVGDASFQAKCYERIHSYQKNGTTLLLVSHSVESVVKHCSRALFLHQGCLAEDGEAGAVTNLYLDQLFGHRRQRGNGQISPDTSAATLQEFSAGAQELFHTRPGYRKEEHRWGRGGAAIIDYTIVTGDRSYPPQIEGNAQTDFYFKVRFDEDLDQIVPGFLIKTLDGIFLYGTNSFVATGGYRPMSAQRNEVVVYRFSLPLTLNQGYYLVSFGVATGDPLHTLIPLDRRYDSVIINVGHTAPFWGMVDLQASFEVAEGHKFE